MKRKQWHRQGPTVVLLVTMLGFIATAMIGCGAGTSNQPADPSNLQPQTGVGSKYGTRDPYTCKSTKAPAHGAISPEVAAQYVACNAEGETGGMLYLLQNVKVEVGAGRAFNPNSDDYADIDQSSPLYPIRGSFTRYQCGAVSSGPILPNVGKNCNSGDQPNATGVCYKTTFGDWHCSMMDLTHDSLNRFGVPPPAK